jgi:hypothetical protein
MIRSSSAVLLALAWGLPLTTIGPQPARAADCRVPMQGRFAVMAMGTVGNGPGGNGPGAATPTARLLEERWLPAGQVQGRLVERVGESLRSTNYQGTLSLVGTCLVQVRRQLPWGQQLSEAVLDSRGRPLYSLDRTPGTVISSRWLPMAPGSCRAADLNGVVLSSQVGLNWLKDKAGWSPKVQREQWRDGQVQGVALSSDAGVGDSVGYTGQLRLDAGSCWGTLVEQDQKGVAYTYRALLVNGHRGARGYLYVQTDPNDLSVGWLVRD